MEVNPRIQVEHTVTEEITGINIVAKQIELAQGKTFEELGLSQENIQTHGYAIQARITTEDPSKNFQPDSGFLRVFNQSVGNGIRLDGIGYSNYEVTPIYDSLLVKCTARGQTWLETIQKMNRAL